MGVFRTKFVTENVEQCGAMSRNGRETGEREGEAQSTTLHAKFGFFCCVSSVPDFLHDGSRQFRIFRFAGVRPQNTTLNANFSTFIVNS